MDSQGWLCAPGRLRTAFLGVSVFVSSCRLGRKHCESRSYPAGRLGRSDKSRRPSGRPSPLGWDFGSVGCQMRAALAALVTLSSIDVVAGGIVLTFSEKTALGSLSRLGGHGIARKPARRFPTH